MDDPRGHDSRKSGPPKLPPFSQSSTLVPTGGSSNVSCHLESGFVAYVVFHTEHPRSNLLTRTVLQDLVPILRELKRLVKAGKVRVVVFYSTKKNFLVGADLGELQAVKTVRAGKLASKFAQGVFNAIQSLPVPTIAAIHGLTLGIGLELCLACTYRVSAGHGSGTAVGFPEVKFGLTPGGGGTVRLPRLVGLSAALSLLLPGHYVDAESARAMGLIDHVLPSQDRFEAENRFFHEVRRFATRQLDGLRRSPMRLGNRERLSQWVIDRSWIGRQALTQWALWKLDRMVGKGLPARYYAAQSLVAGSHMSQEEALEYEARIFGQVLQTPEAKNLIALFFMTEDTKHSRMATNGVASNKDVKKVAVIGAGVMGTGITALLLRNGYKVLLKDVRRGFSTGARARVAALLWDAVRKDWMSRMEMEEALSRLEMTAVYDMGLWKTVDLVLETAVERMEVKKTILGEVESVVREDTVIATNTSSLSINSVASISQRPSMVVGLHFFNPVDRMKLVEIIKNKSTTNETVATVYEFALALNKVPVVVADGPGFLMNRIVTAYLIESTRIVVGGGSIEEVDALFRDFGLPVGPFKLMDYVGLDLSMEVASILERQLGNRFRVNKAFRETIAGAVRLGAKSGLGFYVYPPGTDKAQGVDPGLAARIEQLRPSRQLLAVDVVDRGILTMINEASRCLEEGIARRPEDVDLASVFGMGFPRYRAGLLQYAEDRGIGRVVERLDELASRYGPRFRPTTLLRDLAESRGRFYPNRPRATVKDQGRARM